LNPPGPVAAGSLADSCRSCGAGLSLLTDFGDQPLANGLMPAGTDPAADVRYSLRLMFCAGCSLVQLGQTVDPVLLFGDYVYLTRYSTALADSFGALARRVHREASLGGGDLVYDIGCNDGTLLRHYQQLGVRVVGVDPSPAAAAAEADGVPLVREYFGPDVAKDLVSAHGRGAVAHIHNCLAHCTDLPGVVLGLRELVGAAGMVIVETPSVLDLVDNVRVDTVYHEHVSYFSMTSLANALRSAGLYPWHVEHTDSHGDSLLVYARAAKPAAANAVRAELDREAADGISGLARYLGFARDVEVSGRGLRAFLREATGRGESTVAYGAAAKATMLLNVFGVDVPDVQFAVDHSPHKIGLRIPGTHLTIRPPGELMTARPDVVLVTAWNHAEEIVRTNAWLARGGSRFVTPLPEVRSLPCPQ